jgi:hypothetical protein
LADVLLGVSSLCICIRWALTHHKNLNSWTLALTTIALSSLLIWPNATDQALIIVYVLSHSSYAIKTHASPVSSSSAVSALAASSRYSHRSSVNS